MQKQRIVGLGVGHEPLHSLEDVGLGRLRGCINDCKNVSTFLIERYGYKREDMVILTDDQQNAMSQPKKANILRAMH